MTGHQVLARTSLKSGLEFVFGQGGNFASKNERGATVEIGRD